METAIPEQTKHGKIFGRDAIFLDEIVFPNENQLILCGVLNTYGGQDEQYKIKFKDTVHISMTTLDLAEAYEGGGSFCRVENSTLIKQLNQREGFPLEEFIHFHFQTYDTVFAIVAEGYELNFYPLSTPISGHRWLP